MSIKPFVGGLNYSTDGARLRRGFEHFGEVDDVAVINDRDTGRSRGFGFVTFAERAAGERAIQEMDGSELDGRSLRVNEAAERSPRGGESFGGGGGGPRGKGRSRRGDRSARW
jgi:RNA recognition motif-containing protein